MTQARLFAAFRTYVGQTRCAAMVADLAAAGIGECTVRGELPPRRQASWFHDNGAYTDFVAGRPFDYLRWSRDMRAIRMWCERGELTRPDFVVVPDLVAQGAASLAFSLEHLAESRAAGAPCYLAVQDGMTVWQVRRALAHFDGIFVGGSLEWKLATAATWVRLGRQLRLPVHVGRVGTLDRVEWAAAIGASSIDSSFPLWTRERLGAFVEAVR